MATKKYRPYFTLPELKHIEQCLIAVMKHQDPQTKPIIRYLHKYITDIESNYRSPNHTLKPSMIEKLGFSDSPVDEPCEDDFDAIDKRIDESIKMSKRP